MEVTEPKGNRVLIGRIKLHVVDPKPEWSSYEQVEAGVKLSGGPNRNLLKKVWMIRD